MSINRYFQILYLLLQKEIMTAPELAEIFEVSTRTIYRDIDTLSNMGIPIYASQGKGGGIKISEEFVLNKSFLTEEEQREILMSIQGLSVANQEETNLLLEKLGGIFKQTNYNWIEIDFTDWHNKKIDEKDFETIKNAIFSQKYLKFVYYNSSGKIQKRTIEPLKILLKNNNWYLYAFCIDRKDFRTFKLTRMKNITTINKNFNKQIPEKIIHENKMRNENTVNVTLQFTSKVMFRICDEFDEAITYDKNKNIIITTKLPHNEKLFSYLFSFGNEVKVLSPSFIVEEYQFKLNQILETYRT